MATVKEIVLAIAKWVVEWATPPVILPPTWIEGAVKDAYYQVGLPVEQFSYSFDLLKAGKLQDVLYIAANKLDHDNSFRTVGDVIDILQ